MKLILVRHGDPDYANDTLTDLGFAQVARLGEAFRGVTVDDLYVSPMGRAQRTCEPIAAALGREPEVLPWLHELNGNYEGHLWAWDQPGADILADSAACDRYEWRERVPYGPHMARVAETFYSSFEKFMAARGYHLEGDRYRLDGADTDRTVVFVCHAGIIQTLLSHLLHVPLPVCYHQTAILPSSRTTLALQSRDSWGVFRLFGLNDLSHLEPRA